MKTESSSNVADASNGHLFQVLNDPSIQYIGKADTRVAQCNSTVKQGQPLPINTSEPEASKIPPAKQNDFSLRAGFPAPRRCRTDIHKPKFHGEEMPIIEPVQRMNLNSVQPTIEAFPFKKEKTRNTYEELELFQRLQQDRENDGYAMLPGVDPDDCELSSSYQEDAITDKRDLSKWPHYQTTPDPEIPTVSQGASRKPKRGIK